VECARFTAAFNPKAEVGRKKLKKVQEGRATIKRGLATKWRESTRNSLHCNMSNSSRAEKILRRGRSADLQSALDERTHQAGCKPALRIGCGSAALRSIPA
jgi:hypothetical protein